MLAHHKYDKNPMKNESENKNASAVKGHSNT